MHIAEQHRIVHELVNKYKFQTEAVYKYIKNLEGYCIDIFTEDTNHIRDDYKCYYVDFVMLIVVITGTSRVPTFKKSIQELQETCFQDLLNPTENELTLFELIYGFKWPLQLFEAMP